jgi:hypothetical protein
MYVAHHNQDTAGSWLDWKKIGGSVKKAVNGDTTISITSIFVLVIDYTDGLKNREGIWI